MPRNVRSLDREGLKVWLSFLPCGRHRGCVSPDRTLRDRHACRMRGPELAIETVEGSLCTVSSHPHSCHSKNAGVLFPAILLKFIRLPWIYVEYKVNTFEH